jgi:hypothetical protein
MVISGCFASPYCFAAEPKDPTEDRPQYTNRLINEKSPYLLQHAHNPVDWYPWGEEAFVKAEMRINPSFFLSVIRPATGVT